MKNILSIFNVTVRGIFGLNKILSGSGSVRRRALVRLISISALVLFLAGAVFAQMYGIGILMQSFGATDSILSLAVVAASILIFLDVLFRATNTLFSFNDYDMLMSMPIKTRSVVFGRLFSMYVFDLAFALAIMLPTLVAYAMLESPDPAFYMRYIISALATPLIPIVVGTIPGLLISFLASRMRRKNIAQLILTIGLMGAYFYVYYGKILPSLSGVEGDEFYNLAARISTNIQSIYPPSAWFAKGVSTGAIVDLLLFIFAGAVVFALLTFLINAWYKRLHSILTSRKNAKKYALRSVKRSSLFSALYKREWRKYLSSPVYVANTIIGHLMSIACGVLLLVFGPDFIGQVFSGTEASELAETMPVILSMAAGLLPYVIMFLVTMGTTTSTSISIEGKQLWILKALPVSAMSIFNAKLALDYTLSITASLITSALFAIALKQWLDAISIAMVFVLPLAYVVLFGILGIWGNLLLPKLDWKTETQVVKQSGSMVLVNMGGAFFAFIPPVLMFIFDLNPKLVNSITSVIVLAVAIFAYLRLRAVSEKRFTAL